MEWFSASLLPQTPYIGGEDNHLTENLSLTVPLLALSGTQSAWQACGRSGTESSTKVQPAMLQASRFNVMLWVKGRRILSRGAQEKLKQRRLPVEPAAIPAIGFTNISQEMVKRLFLVWITLNAAS